MKTSSNNSMTKQPKCSITIGTRTYWLMKPSQPMVTSTPHLKKFSTLSKHLGTLLFIPIYHPTKAANYSKLLLLQRKVVVQQMAIQPALGSHTMTLPVKATAWLLSTSTGVSHLILVLRQQDVHRMKSSMTGNCALLINFNKVTLLFMLC